jgi:hypothetical protein
VGIFCRIKERDVNYTRAAIAAVMSAGGGALCFVAAIVGLGVTVQATFGSLSSQWALLAIFGAVLLAIVGGAIMARTIARSWWKALLVSVVAHIAGVAIYAFVVRRLGVGPPGSGDPGFLFVPFLFALLYVFAAPLIVVFSVVADQLSFAACREALLPALVALALIGAVVVTSWNTGVLVAVGILVWTLLPALAVVRRP